MQLVWRWRKIFKNFYETGKNQAIQNQISLLKLGEKEIKDQSKILQNSY